MAVHSLFPAYVLFNYHSAWGAHTQIVPTKEWFEAPLVPGNVLGNYQNWSSVPCDGEEMIDELVLRLSAFNVAGTIYDTATIYTKASETAPAIPRATKALGVAGTLVSTNWSKAVMQTFIMRDTAYNLFKLVQLDAPIGSGWDAVSNISGSAAALALTGAVSALGWAWASRAGLRPANFQKITYKLNDKLREEYGMS